MTPKKLEGVLVTQVVRSCARLEPDSDIEATRLSDLGHSQEGIMLTIDDQEFEIVVNQVR